MRQTEQSIYSFMSIRKGHFLQKVIQSTRLMFFKYCQALEKLTLHLKVEKIFLTWEELEKLAAAELPEHQAKVRDCYLFASYTELRYSDMNKFTRNHIS